MSEKKSERIIVKTGEVRFSFVKIFPPEETPEGKKKYSLLVMIPKSDQKTIASITEAVKQAKEEGRKSYGDKFLMGEFKKGVHNGEEKFKDKEYADAYKDFYVINASTYRCPAIIDVHRNELTSDESFYSGCYGKVILEFAPFSITGNKGIKVWLGNILKTKDGERFTSASTAEESFAEDLIINTDDLPF